MDIGKRYYLTKPTFPLKNNKKNDVLSFSLLDPHKSTNSKAGLGKKTFRKPQSNLDRHKFRLWRPGDIVLILLYCDIV